MQSLLPVYRCKFPDHARFHIDTPLVVLDLIPSTVAEGLVAGLQFRPRLGHRHPEVAAHPDRAVLLAKLGEQPRGSGAVDQLGQPRPGRRPPLRVAAP